MQFKPLTLLTALALTAGGAAAQTGANTQGGQQNPGGASVKAADSQSMEKLQQAAQRLRESIQALAQKKPGADRDSALAQAHEALLETQRAMIALPPELRTTSTASSADYDKSVKELMRAADSLRESVQAMAQQAPGERRNRAMDQARQALWDTQQAMISAYDPGHSGSGAMGSGKAAQGSTTK